MDKISVRDICNAAHGEIYSGNEKERVRYMLIM